MEEYDDLVPTPEADGRLVLTYRGWTLVDDVVWTMGRELLVLDVSFNAVTEFPPELGDLIHLRELNCSNNKLASLPKQIGKLRTMHVLKANGNKLTRLPDELGLCSGLVYMNIGENRLVTVPPTLANLSNIEELHLCNNRMNYFPPTAGLQAKLAKIDLTNNPALAHMFPVALQGNHEFIRWMCAKRYVVDPIQTCTSQRSNSLLMLLLACCCVFSPLLSNFSSPSLTHTHVLSFCLV